jgi:hypothetical protein
MLIPLVVKDNGMVKIKQVTIRIERLGLHMHSAVGTIAKERKKERKEDANFADHF